MPYPVKVYEQCTQAQILTFLYRAYHGGQRCRPPSVCRRGLLRDLGRKYINKTNDNKEKTLSEKWERLGKVHF